MSCKELVDWSIQLALLILPSSLVDHQDAKAGEITQGGFKELSALIAIGPVCTWLVSQRQINNIRVLISNRAYALLARQFFKPAIMLTSDAM